MTLIGTKWKDYVGEFIIVDFPASGELSSSNSIGIDECDDVRKKYSRNTMAVEYFYNIFINLECWTDLKNCPYDLVAKFLLINKKNAHPDDHQYKLFRFFLFSLGWSSRTSN